jgi:hypothetical protein
MLKFVLTKCYNNFISPNIKVLAIDLRLPRIIRQDPRTVVKVENFDPTYKDKIVSEIQFSLLKLRI